MKVFHALMALLTGSKPRGVDADKRMGWMVK